MRKGWIIQGILFLCILLLIGSFLSVPSNSQTPMETVVSDTCSSLKLEDYTLEENKNIRRFLSIDPTTYSGVTYYKNNDDMQASEIVIVQFKENSQSDAFKTAMEQRKNNQSNVYSGYLPEQATLVNNAVIYTQANYGIYVVNKDTESILTTFKTSLKKGESK